MAKLQLLFVVIALSTLGVVVRFIRRGDLDLRYSLLWLLGSGAMVFFALFPSALQWISHALGFQVASNAFLTFALLVFALMPLAQSVALTRSNNDLRRLAQEFALRQAAV